MLYFCCLTFHLYFTGYRLIFYLLLILHFPLILHYFPGAIIQLGVWLEAQRKSRKDLALDQIKSDRFDSLVDAGKLDWRFNGFTFSLSDASSNSASTHPNSSARPSSSSSSSSLSAPSSSSSSSSSTSSSSSCSGGTEMRGTWILAFEALVRFRSIRCYNNIFMDALISCTVLLHHELW